MASRHALPTALLATAGPKARLRRASAVHDPLYSTALALVLRSAMGSPAALAQTVAASGDVLPGIPPPPACGLEPCVGVNAQDAIDIDGGGGTLAIQAGGRLDTGSGVIGSEAGKSG